MGQTGADILSIEQKASSKYALEQCGPDVILMGGIDTANTLYMKEAETIKEVCEKSIADGIQILAPGCAMSPGTATENLLAKIGRASCRERV